MSGVQNVIIVLSDGGAGNAGNLWSSTTNQATLAGGTTLTMAATVPSDVIPGTSVADNTTSSAIPSGTQVVSTSGNTSNALGRRDRRRHCHHQRGDGARHTTLKFASVPSAVTTGMAANGSNQLLRNRVMHDGCVHDLDHRDAFERSRRTRSRHGHCQRSHPGSWHHFDLRVVAGKHNTRMGVTDTTNGSAIPSGTTIVSFNGTTVTISKTVGRTVTGNASGTTNKSTKLTFSSLTGTPQTGMTVTGSGVPANTTVTSVSGTTVIISQQASVANGTTITFSGNNVATGDTITFSKDVASGDSISFGGVGCGHTIAFGSNNQCHEAITAAQDAANASTWVYSIAYGSYTQLSPNSNSCSDIETPAISSCRTMQDIADSPGVIPDPSKFYSDPMNVSPACTSPDNPNTTDITAIFSNLGFGYTSLLPNNTN